MDNPPSPKPPGGTGSRDAREASSTESDDLLLGDCQVDTFRSGGPGGQRQNKVESGIRLTHRPTGIVVVSRRHRSQNRNRREALRRLREELERRSKRDKPRIRTRVPRAERRKRLDQKKKRSRLKRLRKKPRPDEN